MTYNFNDYLMTPEEFAELVVSTMHEQKYFARNEKHHPEDIEAAFSSIAYTVAKTVSYLSIRNKQVANHMPTGNDDDVYSRYSEWKRTKKAV